MAAHFLLRRWAFARRNLLWRERLRKYHPAEKGLVGFSKRLAGRKVGPETRRRQWRGPSCQRCEPRDNVLPRRSGCGPRRLGYEVQPGESSAGFHRLEQESGLAGQNA